MVVASGGWSPPPAALFSLLPRPLTFIGVTRRYSPGLTGTVASTALGIFLGVLSNWIFDGAPAVNFANGLLGACLGLLITDVITRAAHDEASSVQAELRASPELRRVIEDAARAHAFVATFPRSDALGGLCRERFLELCSDQGWGQLADGKLLIDPFRELSFNRDALAICKSALRAASWQDEPYWSTPEGRTFLEASRRFVLAGGTIIRIFILDRIPEAEDIAQMKAQSELGISVRLLTPPAVEERDKADFVLYDDVAVRTGESTLGTRKRATLSLSEKDVRHFIHRFRDLMERSVSFDDYRN